MPKGIYIRTSEIKAKLKNNLKEYSKKGFKQPIEQKEVRVKCMLNSPKFKNRNTVSFKNEYGIKHIGLKSQIIALYIKGYSIPYLSKKFRIHHNTLYRYLNKFNIKIRNQKESKECYYKNNNISEETRKKHSKIGKELWSNQEYREKTIKATLKALFETRPTSLERQMIDIIKKYNLPYKYTGDGSILIGYKNPDFININGDKICIEVANDVRCHHAVDYPEKRKEHFAKYGWKCIVFMTNKLDENIVIEEFKKEGIMQ